MKTGSLNQLNDTGQAGGLAGNSTTTINWVSCPACGVWGNGGIHFCAPPTMALTKCYDCESLRKEINQLYEQIGALKAEIRLKGKE